MGKKERKEKKALELPGLGDEGEPAKLRVNEEYAKKFEQKKRYLELRDAERRAQKEEEEEEDTSESEDEDGVLVTPSVEKSFLALLPLIRKRDPAIYDKKKSFFPEYEETVKEAMLLERTGGPKEKVKTLKDLEREDILRKMEKGDEAFDSDEEEEVTPRIEIDPKTQKKEQKKLVSQAEELSQLKQQFIASTGGLGGEEDDSDSDDDLFVKKSKTEQEEKQLDEQFAEWEKKEVKAEKLQPLGKNATPEEMLQHFWAGQTLSSEDKFLREYILKEKWAERKPLSYDDIQLSDDESEVEKQENFEAKYNFRFEDEDASNIVTHPRTIEDSVRRVVSKRKKQREKRKEKKLLEKVRKEEEIKRLKNLKKQEIQEKMEEIRKVTGADMSQLESLLADSAYDPDKFEEQMQSLFDDRFYEQEDEEFLPGQGKGDEDDEEMEDYDPVIEEDTEQVASGSKGFKQARVKAAQTLDETTAGLKDRLEEYYNLDYEDMIGDTPVRFGYTKVPANDFGLSVEEILGAEDQELSSYVPLKWIAPYRKQDARPRGRWHRKRRAPAELNEAPEQQEEQPQKKKHKKRKRSKKA